MSVFLIDNFAAAIMIIVFILGDRVSFFVTVGDELGFLLKKSGVGGCWCNKEFEFNLEWFLHQLGHSSTSIVL